MFPVNFRNMSQQAYREGKIIKGFRARQMIVLLGKGTPYFKGKTHSDVYPNNVTWSGTGKHNLQM